MIVTIGISQGDLRLVTNLFVRFGFNPESFRGWICLGGKEGYPDLRLSVFTIFPLGLPVLAKGMIPLASGTTLWSFSMVGFRNIRGGRWNVIIHIHPCRVDIAEYW